MPGDGERCSAFSARHAVDPIGTAGSYDAVVRVGLPLPWPARIENHPGMEAVAAIVSTLRSDGLSYRVQAVPAQRLAEPSVTVYRRTADWFRRFERDDGDGSSTEILVCTHGRRDICCGTLGTTLWKTLTEGNSVSGASVDRTSHLGGHRFAPNVMLLPEGTVWGRGTRELVETVVTRSGPVSEVLPHYRGSLAMPTPAVQAVEREAFAAEGWDWLDHERRGFELGSDAGCTTARVEYRRSGKVRAYEGTVRVRRQIPAPSCGAALVTDTASEPELEVVACLPAAVPARTSSPHAG